MRKMECTYEELDYGDVFKLKRRTKKVSGKFFLKHRTGRIRRLFYLRKSHRYIFINLPDDNTRDFFDFEVKGRKVTVLDKFDNYHASDEWIPPTKHID